jgi:hypothetical protein
MSNKLKLKEDMFYINKDQIEYFKVGDKVIYIGSDIDLVQYL